MNKIATILVALIIVLMPITVTAYTFNDKEPVHNTIAQVIEGVQNSLAKLEITYKENGRPDYETITTRYEIVIITADTQNDYYEAITSAHILLPDEETIQITIGNIVIQRNYNDADPNNNIEYYFPVRKIAYDPMFDLTLVSFKINNTPTYPPINPPITEIVLGDAYKLKRGDDVIAIGSPSGNENTITVGPVSEIEWDCDIPNFPRTSRIQHQALMVYGNSGGPLFNLQGELVGINISLELYSYYLPLYVSGKAIPSNIVNQRYPFLTEQINLTNTIEKVKLPFTMQSIYFSKAAQEDYHGGIKIISVLYAPGLKKDYLVLRIGGEDGMPISSPTLFSQILTYSFYKEKTVKLFVAEAEYIKEQNFLGQEIELVAKINKTFEIELPIIK